MRRTILYCLLAACMSPAVCPEQAAVAVVFNPIHLTPSRDLFASHHKPVHQHSFLSKVEQCFLLAATVGAKAPSRAGTRLSGDGIPRAAWATVVVLNDIDQCGAGAAA